MANTTGLINHLIKWGLKVEEVPGWRTRGRPYRFEPKAIIIHHTASGRKSGNKASLRIVSYGRSDLPGPLSQFLLARDGTVVMVAGGYSNHAGTGGPRSVVPRNQGNTYCYGIEAENDGVGEAWPEAQLQAYYRLCAALLEWMGTTDVSRVFGHKEWTSRKIDPAGIDMTKFRGEVKKLVDAGPNTVVVSLANLKPGLKNKDVRLVKQRLKERGFFTGGMGPFFGPYLVEGYKAWQESLGYSGADADGVPGRASLQTLGFQVVK